MTATIQTSPWLTEKEVAAILRLNPVTLRAWRQADRREGRGSFDRPGYGGLVWKAYGRSIRYAPLPELVGQPEVQR